MLAFQNNSPQNPLAFEHLTLLQSPGQQAPPPGVFLPDIKGTQQQPLVRTNSKSSMRTQQTMSTDLSHFKKASPEALALMMRNLKNNNKGASKAWVPGGRDLKKDAAGVANAKKLFY